MAQQKEMKVRLDITTHEAFYRLFPNYGERQAIMKKLIERLIKRAGKEREFLDDILEGLRE